MSNNTEIENIAETLARVLPEAKHHVIKGLDEEVGIFTLPIGVKIKTIDLEKFQPHPRRKTGTAAFTDVPSFAAYIATHAIAGTTAWSKFNPQTFDLAFAAVLDEHSKDEPGWRGHRATFVPDKSAEWKAWIAQDGKSLSQLDFAEFIEEQSSDIVSVAGSPTDLQMLTMATQFVANEDRQLKSSVRLQSGGVNLSYVADVDAGTVEAMTMFKGFTIGIPVFQGSTSAYPIGARLKFKLGGGKVSFYYELIRTDRVHQTAAQAMIAEVKEALGATPLLMGSMA